MLIRENFEKVQEKDYKQLFDMVTSSYYVTSFGDHDVWVIHKKLDLNYYWDNYKRNQKLKLNNNKTLTIKNGGSDIELAKGINRIFITTDEKIDESITKDNVSAFAQVLNNLIKDNGIFDILPPLRVALGITDENYIESKIQFLSTILAAKIHKLLQINFAFVYPIFDTDTKKDLEILGIEVKDTNGSKDTNGYSEDRKKLSIKRLGSASFDNTVYAYAERIPADGEKVLVYYQFNTKDVDRFILAMHRLVTKYEKFTKFISIDDKYSALNKPAKKIANIIKGMDRHLL